MFSKKNILGSFVLDHLGLVASTIEKLGISDAIDKRMPVTKGAKTSYGQRVSAMLLNGLGFMDDRLYLFSKFLENKPVSKLLGENVSALQFNDDSLGRCLDAIHEYGTTKLFSEIALSIGLKYKLLGKSADLDTTTLTVYGAYENDEIDHGDDVENRYSSGALSKENDRLSLPRTPIPSYGYAKNKRFDLKQMTLLLATSGAANFPIWMESHAGNASDQTTLESAATRMQNFCKHLENAPSFLYVGDSAMYANCVKNGSDLIWLSRVPDNIKQAKNLLFQEDIPWVDLENGYKMYPLDQVYQGIAQRWVLIYSQQAYDKELVTLEKNIEKEAIATRKMLWHLAHQLFGCSKDLDKQIAQINKKLKYHTVNYSCQAVPIYAQKGRPKKDAQPIKVEYQVQADLVRDENRIAQYKLSKGRFILATNQLDKTQLKDEEVLSNYKEQSGTESGFKFIKDDTFEVDSIFLKKPERISALMMVMTLCLMVYSFAQYFLREQLASSNQTIVSQSGHNTKRPSMKWVYRLFHGVHVLKLSINNTYQEIVLNLNEMLIKIIRYFGPMACSIYDIEYETL